MPYWSFLGLWLKIGLLGIGGPANQIGLIHKEIVEKRGLISEERFQAGLSFCLLLPGPEAQQLAVYSGWLTHGLKGALSAGAAFVLPGLLIMLALCAAYVRFGTEGLTPGVLSGLKAAVSFFLIEALIRLGRKTIKNTAGLLAALIGLGVTAMWHVAFFWIALGIFIVWLVMSLRGGQAQSPSQPLNLRQFTFHSFKIFSVWGAIWAAPSLILWLVFGPDMMLTRLSLIMTGAAGLSFGGAYAAIAQAAHGLRGDLTSSQILDGIGLSEITPGPLVLGLVFMSFVSAYQAAPEPMAWVWAFSAAGLSAFVIFVPSYMWILWGTPFIEPLTQREGVRSLFNLIACAAIALIALMAWQFITAYLSLMTPGGIRVYIGPVSFDIESLFLILAAAGVYFVSRRSHLITLIGLCALGLGLSLL